MKGEKHEASHRSSCSPGPGRRDDSARVGEGVQSADHAPAIDPGIAAALDVVAKARLEKEWEA